MAALRSWQHTTSKDPKVLALDEFYASFKLPRQKVVSLSGTAPGC